MAEKDFRANPATDPGGEALRDQQLQFKKRARRRLVGAIALALLAVIVLPMVMDQQPKPLNQDIQIRIPSQDASAVSNLTRSVTGKPAPTPLPAAPQRPAAAASTPAATAQPEAKPEIPPLASGKREMTKSDAATPAAPSKASEAKAEKVPSTPADQEQWVVQLGAYRDSANVTAMQNRLKGLGLPSFTEKIETPQGPRTRVRSGPFPSRAAAERAQAQLKKLAIGAPAGGVVAQKP